MSKPSHTRAYDRAIEAEMNVATFANRSEIDRRGVLLAMGTTAAVGLEATSSPQGRAASGSSGLKIDAHTHFAQLKFLDFAEKVEGRPFGLSPIFRSRPALTDVKSRVDLLDRNEIDVNVLVPTPWIEGFPKIYADPTLAVQAARLMNDELATVIAARLPSDHSITSSASASSRSGTSRPSALAVLTLTTSSNFVGSITGRSAGFSPLRMRPA